MHCIDTLLLNIIDKITVNISFYALQIILPSFVIKNFIR